MAIICRNHNLLFIMTPRTACTAVGNLLCQDFGGQFLPAEDMIDANGRICVQQKHSTLAELIKYNLLSEADAKKLFKVAAVRNPFDTLVSLYFKQRYKYQPLLSDPTSWVNRSPTYANNMRYAQEHSFGRWILRKCAKQLLKQAFGWPPSMFSDYTHGVNEVLKYETINADLQNVGLRLGMGKIDIPMINRTEERDVRDYRFCYSRLTISAVNVAYSADMQKYGYRF